MKRFAAMLVLVTATVATVGAGMPTLAADPVKLIERAIETHGGAATLRSLPSFKATGRLEPGGRATGRSYDATIYERSDGARRSEVVFDFRGRKVTSVEVYDGRVCKRRTSSGWDDLPRDEQLERVAHRIDFLLAALERAPTLEGEASEGGVTVWRVSVPDGRGRALLSLAVDDGRLVALEYPGTEAEGMGVKKEVVWKIFYHAFETVAGALLPTDIEIFKDGSFDSRWRFDRVEAVATWNEEWLEFTGSGRRFIPTEELAN